jgi:hypothetical protein
MTDPIDKGKIPVSNAVARWALFFAILGLIWAVCDGFGSLKCICDKLDGVTGQLKGIAATLPTGGHGPGGGAGTISIGSGGGGGGSVTANWSITEGSTTRQATHAGSRIIRYDAIGQMNIFQARASATPTWINIKKYTVKIKEENTNDTYTLIVEGVFPNLITWTMKDQNGNVLPLTTCGPTPACSGDLPDELFGTLQEINYEPVVGAPPPGSWTARSQTVVE